MSGNFWQTAGFVSLVFFSTLMLVLGSYLLIAGKFRIRKYHLQGWKVRFVGSIFILGATLFFLNQERGFFHKYGLLIQAIIFLAGLILLWIMSKKPAAVDRLFPGTHTLQSKPHEPAYRLHLRLNKDGSGILVVNASTILHLNASAAEFAYHLMKGTTQEDVANVISDRYRITKEIVKHDYAEFQERIQALIHTPDLDPVSYLDFERVSPYSQALTSPLRLDCALTYRLPSEVQIEYAPTKRVDRELSTQEWKEIMDKAWAAGIPHIIFTGGEPTLREDLPALIAHAEKNGQVCGLLTSGLKLADRSYLMELLNTGLDHLLFLLQPEVGESWKVIEIIIPEDIFFTVHYTLTNDNIRGAGDVIRKLAKLGVKNLSLGLKDPSLNDASLLIRDQAINHGMTMRWDLPVPYSQDNPVTAEGLDEDVPDGAGRAWLYVEPDGDVLPSQGYADKILGNILRDPWEMIYKV